MAATTEVALLGVTHPAEGVLCVPVRRQTEQAQQHLDPSGKNVDLDNNLDFNDFDGDALKPVGFTST